MLWLNGILLQPGGDYEVVTDELEESPGFRFYTPLEPTDVIQYRVVNQPPDTIGVSEPTPAGTFIPSDTREPRETRRPEPLQPETEPTEPPPSVWDRILEDDEIC